MPLTFRYMRMKDDGDVLSCDSCQSEAPLEWFDHGWPRTKRKLCEVCASTHIGNHTDGTQDQSTYLFKQTQISIAQVANLLLDKLTPRRQSEADAEILPPEPDDQD